jgi:hypothetical protein
VAGWPKQAGDKDAGAMVGIASECGEEGMAMGMDCDGGGQGVGPFIGPWVAGDGQSGW